MRWAAGLAGVIAVLGVVVLLWPAPEPDRSEVVHSKPVPVERPTPSPTPGPADEPASLPDRGPNGMPIEYEAGRELRTQGLPDREGKQALQSAAAWQSERARAQQRWALDLRAAAVTALAEEDDPTRKAVLARLDLYSGAVVRTRTQILTGSLTPAAGRTEVKRLRSEVATDMQGLLGGRTEGFRAALADAVLGGGW